MPVKELPPANLVIAALAEIDSKMGINPAGDEIQIKVSAICELLANPPPMIEAWIKRSCT